MTELKEIWWFLVPLIGAVVWLIRLESKVNTNCRAIEALEDYKKTIKEINNSVIGIQKDIGWLKDLLEKILKDKTQ